MSSNLSGKFTLSVEYGSESGKPWVGSLIVPGKVSKSAKFELFSENASYSTLPFSQLEGHSRSVVRGWVNFNRPITLIEPFINYIGGGAWSRGYRESSVVKGMVSEWIEDEHMQGSAIKEVFEVGFSSETLNFICNEQLPPASAASLSISLSQVSPLKYSVELSGIGEVTITKLSYVDESNRLCSRAFTRLVNPHGLTLWQVIKFCRLQLTLLDFLAGKPEGGFMFAILGARGQDSPLRLKTFDRGVAGKKLFQTRAKLEEPVQQFAAFLSKAWHDEVLKRQIFSVTTLSNASLGLIERFVRTIAYLESFLRENYEAEGLSLRRSQYREGIDGYRAFLKSGGLEIIDFSEKFARPSYPKNATLRELLHLAIEECKPLGLFSEEKYEEKIVQLRNEVFHGQERSATSWIKDIQYATEFGIAILELLTARNLGLRPPQNYQPRNDIFRSQLGILGKA